MNEQTNEKSTCIKDFFAGFVFIFMISIFVLVFYFIFDKCTSYSKTTNWNYAFFIGGMVAVAYQIMIMLTGGWKNAFNVFVERWHDFFTDLKMSFWFAFKSLLSNYRDKGIVLVWYLLIFLCSLNMCIHGCLYLVELYGF